ncbi:uncharacterized protein LOC143892067 isoform X2 [Tasmannia lanceolata]|uniref:uncharacterized protein LOC143892067 isoform X2 n=1 Tax=Tasmannia lanceolata TaxID=3420 RepID=UPI0040633342
MQNMDCMDTDQVMDVPDTPDRLVLRKINESLERIGGEDLTKVVGSSVLDDSVNGGLLDRGIEIGLKASYRPSANNGNRMKLCSNSNRQSDTGIHDESKGSGLFIAFGSDMTSTSDGFKKFENTHVRKMQISDRASKKLENNKHCVRTQHTGPTLDLNTVPLDIPSSSHGSDRAKLGSASPDISEIADPTVKVQGGSRQKMIDATEKIAFNVSYPDRGRYPRRKMPLGHRGSNLGKDLSTEIPPRPFICHDDNHVLNVDEWHEFKTTKSEMGCSHGTSKNHLDREMCTGSSLSGGSDRETQSMTHQTYEFFPPYDAASSCKAFSNACKSETNGKYDGAGTSMDHVDASSRLKDRDFGEGIDPCSDSQPNTEQIVLVSPQSVISPRKTERRRLVRNGCISPYNIAKSKSTSENNCNSVTDGKNGKGPFNNSSDGTCQISILNAGSEGNQIDRMKGKGVVENTALANECNARIRSSSNRDLLIHGEEDSGTGDANGDIFRSAEEIGGWRSTRNRSKKTYLSSSHEVLNLSSRDNGVQNSFGRGRESITDGPDHMTGFNANPEIDLQEVRYPSSIQHAGSENERHRESQKLMKRQRKRTSTRNRLGECSSSTFDDLEVSYLCSSGEPSNVRPTRSSNSRHRGILGPVIEVDELSSPETRWNKPQGAGCVVNDDSSARGRQVEADEILARQLQEQFYHESPVVGGSEIDASIAWTLQHEDAQRAASIRSRGLPNLSSSVRSTNRGRLPSSARMQQLRRNFHAHSLGISSRGRSIQFPSSMDLDTRLHLLEALETAVGNSGDMARTGHFLQVQRDFNENDYEMLLALDDDNHEHVGASSNQINSLPQSTVQTANFEEACAICLETPSMGENIRHLPCLHKFHRECIDPWLRRRTSCPICKSGIT